MTGFRKILLHASKYPSRPVIGLLLSSPADGKHTEEKEKKGSQKIVDIIPLFHNLPLSPIIETALIQVEEYLGGSESIIGLYFSNDNKNNRQIPSLINKLANKIIKLNQNNSFILAQLDISKMEGICSGHSALYCCRYNEQQGYFTPLQELDHTNEVEIIWSSSSSSSSSTTTTSSSSTSVRKSAKDLVSYALDNNRKLIDFEDHIQNVKLFFDNQHLNY